jgi:hypothetical protein
VRKHQLVSVYEGRKARSKGIVLYRLWRYSQEEIRTLVLWNLIEVILIVSA